MALFNIDVEGQLEQAAGEQEQGTHPPSKALAGVGVVTGAMAVGVAVYKPPGGVFTYNKLAYYLTLLGVFAAGVAEVWAAFWVSDDARGRLAAGKKMLFAAVVPLVAVVGLGGVATQHKN